MPLTDAAIRAAKPSEKAVKLSDEKGLYLEVAPSGGKWWRLKYRFGGKEKRISLGVYLDVGLKLARERRDEARRLLADGIDPGEHRKTHKSARADAVADLNAPELLSTIRRIEARGRLETAHCALQSCGQVFRYVVGHGPGRTRPDGRSTGRPAPTREKHMAAIT